MANGITKGCAPPWTAADEPLQSDPGHTKQLDETEGSHTHSRTGEITHQKLDFMYHPQLPPKKKT